MAEPLRLDSHSAAVPDTSGSFNPDRNTVQDVEAVPETQQGRRTAWPEPHENAAGPAADPDLGKEVSSAVHKVCQTLPASPESSQIGTALGKSVLKTSRAHLMRTTQTPSVLLPMVPQCSQG